MSINNTRFVTSNDIQQQSVFGIDKGFLTLEAEHANCTMGTIIGPTYTSYSDQPHLATEASNRMACQLSDPGSSVEFIAPRAFSAISLRYSIPDGKEGNGLTYPVLLAVGG